MKKRILSLFIALIIALNLMPITVMADTPEGMVIYVGDVDVTSGGYWTTDSEGNVASAGETQPSDSYIHYDTENNVLTLHNATIRKSVSSETNTYVMGAGIGVFNQNGAAELTIQLEGTNTIENVSTGIHVLAFSNFTGDASLTIMGDGSLNANGSQNGIRVVSNGGDATLSIENAKVTATASKYVGGVLVQSKDDSSVSLTVDGGSLTASGNTGISFWFGTGYSVSGVPNVTVSDNAVVDAKDGGIANNSPSAVQVETGSGNNGGIVWDGKDGTVYGDVTLQENITINEGESLKLDSGASLDANGHNVIVDGGTVEDSIKNSLGDGVKYAPTITTASLQSGEVGTAYSQTLAADGTTPITWSINSSSLPDGLTLDTDTGEITGTPTTANSYTFTVKAENGYGSKTKELTITIDATATVSVSGVSLDKTELRLTEGGVAKLTATVQPTNATNKNVTWKSDNEKVATVDANGEVSAVGVGTAKIIVTTSDGNKTATCTVTVSSKQTPPEDHKPSRPAKPSSESKPEKVYDPHDINKDGVVTCEEKYGEDWYWDEETKACLVKGYSIVIVDTATR